MIWMWPILLIAGGGRCGELYQGYAVHTLLISYLAVMKIKKNRQD